jgi:hypothetical protein
MSESETPSARVLELAEEFLERHRRGERPALKEYLDRHPELADQIRDVFPAMALMEDIALADESLASGVESLAVPSGLAGEFPSRLQLGDFRIIREVGRGGMGVVYEAEQISLGRHVALKVLLRQGLAGSSHLQRFLFEARAAARLHHSNIVPVYGVGEQNGIHYYAMQFIQGRGLDVVFAELRADETGSATITLMANAELPTGPYPDVASPGATRATDAPQAEAGSGTEAGSGLGGGTASDSPSTLVGSQARAPYHSTWWRVTFRRRSSFSIDSSVPATSRKTQPGHLEALSTDGISNPGRRLGTIPVMRLRQSTAGHHLKRWGKICQLPRQMPPSPCPPTGRQARM